MPENIENNNEEKEKIATIAMQIVIAAGDARNYIMEAMDDVSENDYDKANEKLEKAKDKLRQAHIYQTEVVQSEAAGTKYEYSLLFTHAQDTVMTICTELNLAKKIILLYQKVESRICALEKSIG